MAAEQKAVEEAAQAAADLAEKERLESLARQQEEERKRLELERDAERQRLEAEAAEKEAQRQREAEEALRREEERQREEAEAKGREEARLKEEAEAQAREEARLRQEVEAAAREAERERLADEARIAEEERLAALAARPTPKAVMEPMTTLTASPLDEMEGESEPEEKKGLLGRLFGGQKKTVVRRTLDDDMLEKLEELLITADMGVDTALRVTANMAEGRMGKKLSVEEIKTLLSQEVTRIMDGVAKPMPLYSHKPQVVLVVGVNGSGKTTTIGKLASQFKAAGKSVVIAAGDTFRAAAVEQLQVWGDRAGVPVLTAPEGTDPASLAFDAMDQAQKDGSDLLMIDTAGRLQNRSDLMEELSKIVRVIRKKDPDAPHNTLLVLDATTGQNALSQVKTFQELADVSGLVMTKLDGTAKGGVLVALADKFGLPIHAIGVGEQIDDLAPFDPEDFAKALVGLE
ncbi:signal recognition particle-docking protein FtsY [Cognatiyoonia sp.]|uniref:signal recognition particle-docking protein FtsY n=1 Tax=Cognatiyoonia sp. TaxID=2211652 RepID=UPI003F69D58A